LGASVFILLVKCTALIAPKDMKETFVRDAKMDILEIQRAKMDEEQGVSHAIAMIILTRMRLETAIV